MGGGTDVARIGAGVSEWVGTAPGTSPDTADDTSDDASDDISDDDTGGGKKGDSGSRVAVAIGGNSGLVEFSNE